MRIGYTKYRLKFAEEIHPFCLSEKRDYPVYCLKIVDSKIVKNSLVLSVDIFGDRKARIISLVPYSCKIVSS